MDTRQNLTATYDAVAAAYERAAVPVYRQIAKRLLQLIDLRPGWHVLDAGTGTGLVALLGAPRVGKTGKMIGIDLSEAMLELARAKAAQFGFTQCEFRIGDLERLEFPDVAFNAVLSQFALHHTDPAPVLREFHRVLMPGGKLVLQDWADAPNTPHKTMFDALAKYRAADAGDALARARAQSERAQNFRLTLGIPQTMADAARAAGFSDVDARVEKHPARVANADAFIDFASASPLVAAEMAAMPDEVRAAFLREAREAPRAFETANGIGWTYNVVTLAASK
ncbi:MAG: methyltransferase domain-containing protein [Chloroflexota bacterium]|nr:methyltransferase domain-containing protein [Chloroflexota bacterium]